MAATSEKASIFNMKMLTSSSSSLSLLIFLTFSFLIFTLYKFLKLTKTLQNPIKIQSLPLNENPKTTQNQETGHEPEPDPDMTNPSNSTKWVSGFSEGKGFEDDPDCETGSGQEEKKRRKKRVRRKKPDPVEDGLVKEEKEEEFVCCYPFGKKSSSVTQRKIRLQYDQMVKSHGSKGLTPDQVGEFVNCLVEARNDLQTKSEVIKRRFTIFKALLCKADRSSYDRIRQQIYKLELEQKRLEEDAFVYNWLQAQIKVSPAYKKMIEISASTETKAKSSSLVETTDSEFSDISFEEFLAQEKKDGFWQRNGRLKPCSG